MRYIALLIPASIILFHFLISWMLGNMLKDSFGLWGWSITVVWTIWAWFRYWPHSYREEVHGAVNDVYENASRMRALKAPYVMRIDQPVYVGLRHDGKRPESCVIDPKVFHSNHVSILGASGTGKSKIAALILSQLHAAGDACVIFDPKDDEFLPGIMKDAAMASGRPFLFINLREDLPQINPLAGASRDDREMLLQSALDIDPVGDGGVDFHRGADREASNILIDTGGNSLRELLVAGTEIKQVYERENFWRNFKDLCRLEAFQTEDGRDLEGVIAAGGVVYIVGDTDNLRIVSGQKMLLARVLQIIKNRSREGATQVALMLDEFKYMLSNSSMRALGTIRDRRCNLLLAYQSYGDLADCGTLPAKSVLGAAQGNTTLKFVYKLEDGDTAHEFARMAGAERAVSRSQGFSESEDRNGVTYNVTEVEKAAISIDMLTTNLPKPLAGEASVGWVFGLGPAFLISTMHLPAGAYPEVIAARKSMLPEPAKTAQSLI